MARALCWLAGLSILALAAPAAGQARLEERMDGVWQGTVGDLPVRACFDWRDWRSQPDMLGIYYYDSHKRLIRLEMDGRQLDERPEGSRASGALWEVGVVSSDHLAAQWRDGTRSLPVRLERVAVADAGERGSPCESTAFMAPLFAPGEVEQVPAMLGEQAYTRLIYRAPEHLRRTPDDDFDRVAIATFAIPERMAGERAINAVLGLHLPEGGLDDEYARCLIANAAWNGTFGDFSIAAQPEFASDQWLGVIETQSLYCGGAHPSYWEHRRVFDRRHGWEVDPYMWLSNRGVTREVAGYGDVSTLRREITPALKQAILAAWPQGENHEPECLGVAEDALGWDIGLVEDGLAFIPSVPHAATVCADTAVVPWDDIEPFLSPEGRLVMLTLAP